MRLMAVAAQRKNAKMCIVWLKQIKPLHIIGGKNLWQEKSHYNVLEILALWPISMLGKRQLPSESSTILASLIKWVKFMKAVLLWIGWCKSKSVASRLPLRLPPVIGWGWINNTLNTVLISSILRDTLTLR